MNSAIGVITIVVITTMSTVNLATPLRGVYRNPLAQQIERQIAQRKALMAHSLVSMAEARVILGICESTLNKLVASGKLGPIVRYTPRSHRKIRASTLREFMKGVTNGT
jgi:hypothetical protein